MASEEAKALEMLQRFNLNLRKAVLANFPCAYEQYVCLSIPGTVIDTRPGGSFLPAITGITADHRNAINVNEAMLVDSMIPLDKVMLGPTGKSVSRSYLTSLDMLVPRKTDIGTFDLSGGAGQDPNSPEHKYTLAMEYLRRAAPGTVNNSANDVQGAKDSLVKRGIPASTIDMYVRKQLKWSEARTKWDAARNEAIEARESHPELQNATAFSARQKKLKSAQNELHARWMDWVVNGDKLKVDYCFAVVDRDTIMSRIEKAKEATRDAMLSSIDGTEWAQVHLEPANWAQLCREKAVAWATRHPSNPAHTQLQLESLRTMKESYQAYNAQLDQRGQEAGRSKSFDPTSKDLKFPNEQPPKPQSTLKDVTDKAESATPESEKTRLNNLKDAYNDLQNAEGKEEETKKAKWRIAMFEDNSVLENVKKLNTGDLARAEAELRKAYDEMYKLETKYGPLPSVPTPELTAAKKTWLDKLTALKEAQAKDASAQLSSGGLRNLKTAIKSRLTSLDSEIQRLENRLARHGIASSDLPDMIVGVKKGPTDEDSTIEKQKPELGDPSGPGEDSGMADVWTDVAFTVNMKEDDHKQEEHGMSGSFHASVQSWFYSVKAESSFSKNNKTVNDYMASCNISGSFSAMVVNIKRPWLHAELFQDFDMDTPKGTFLSPGAKTIKWWVETDDNEYNGYIRTNYGKFPAYPTAFIVAADTHLSFKGNESNGREVLNILQTDSSVEANYGCWNIGVSAGAHVKSNDQSASQHMEFKDGALQISFQAPQIIGWVSEILPELPRGDIPKFGGLNGSPMMGFRANL
ncbi:hypothetical protein NUW58_g4349 [Xylaria curta]|uniref:Uncharacterized protein n=1 Tax=Xylaria curta TaxID=42375 RepID=A0ACC1P9C6_9PEZI|nr:hypothetical protein NUW58_g4349 [Xylaria curta]